MTAAAQKVKNDDRQQTKKQKDPPKLHRTTFRTSRQMDFFTERELVTQTGHARNEWPLVFVKETIDNALDAAEEAGVNPIITVTANAAGISVKDNGPGLPEATLEGALDFTVRASNREAYCSPTRGAQGNALMTLVPMATVLDPEYGRFVVQAHGKRHELAVRADPISQRPIVDDVVTELPTIGTEVRIEWETNTDEDGDTRWPFETAYVHRRLYELTSAFQQRFLNLVRGFALFNPHATITLDWFGKTTTWQATNPAWLKWKPSDPTSSHWYELRHLERLIGAYITHDRDSGADRLVNDFLAEFNGLSGSAKRTKVMTDSDTKRVKLSELVNGDRFDSDRIATLLAAMQRHTRPVKAKQLGIIGKDHLQARLIAMGAKPETFRYSRKLDDPKSKNRQVGNGQKKQALPGVLETAFGYLGESSKSSRIIIAGANFSPGIGNPFRSFGTTGEGLEAVLTDLMAGASEPIIFAIHLAQPRVEYRDRGKTALVVGGEA